MEGEDEREAPLLEGEAPLTPLDNFQLQLQRQQEEALQDTHAFSRAYVSRLGRLRRWVLAVWTLLFLIGGAIAPKFMEVVLLVFEPPPGTPGEEAMRVMKDMFPGASREWDVIVLINSKDGSTPVLSMADETRGFIESLAENVVRWGKEKASPTTDFTVAHYFLLEELHALTTAHSLLDNQTHPESATAMILSIHKNSGFEQGSMEGNRFADWLDDEMAKLRKKHLPSVLEVRATGMMSFCRDMQEGSERDMLKMDSLSFPFALAMLAYMLRSVRLLIIPMINITIALVVSFMLMYPVAVSTRVIAVAPSVMMSTAVAFSIDYSLFLLSRFREEIIKGSSVKDAVVLMVDSAGHTIMVSGATIAICWLGLLFFPVTLLSTIGLGAGLTVIIAFIVNITLTPALLMTFPDFFTSFERFGTGACLDRCLGPAPPATENEQQQLEQQQQQQQQQEENGEANQNLLGRSSGAGSVMSRRASALESPCAFDAFGRRAVLSPDRTGLSGFATPGSVGTVTRTPTLNADGSVRGKVTSPMFGAVDPVEEIKFLAANSSFYSCGELFFGKPLRALASMVVVCAAILPLTPWAVDFHHSESFKLFTPSDSVATHAALAMEGLYGGGRLAPYQLLVLPDNKTHVLSDKFFSHVQEVVYDVVLDLDYGVDRPFALGPEGVTGMMMMNGHNISFLPSLFKPDSQSVLGCGFDVTEYALELCTYARCAPEVQRCRDDADNCGTKLSCLEHYDGNVTATLQCLTRSMVDQEAIKLASCVTDRCVLHPFRNYTDVLGASREMHSAPQTTLAAAPLAAPALPRPDCPSVLLQMGQSVRISQPQGAWITFNLQIDPFSTDGTEWLDSLRDALKAQAAKDGYQYFLTGGDVAGHDVVNKVFELFPTILGGIFVVVFALMGGAYRSVVVPLRALFTICITLILVYAMGVLTYEHGMLEWTHFHAFENPVHNALSWLVPALIAPVAIGLAMDYDIFLLTRIFEYRHAGFSTKDSIMCGLAQTGGVITAAGIIMFFAFFGLSLSSNAALNQLSFFLCVSVISDTFIIRTILVPSMMVLLREANWWPSVPATLEY